MSDLTRRGFVKNSAAATAGITVLGALLAEQADADADTGADAGADAGASGSRAVVAYVRDPRKGDISVLSGDREVHVHDRKLAAAIARAAG
jgi:hypothetical protein